MVDPELLEKLKTASVDDRIAVIEMLVQSLKSDIKPGVAPLLETTTELQRPAFGFMQNTGTILGDIIAPVLPESTWDAIRFIQHFTPGQGDYTHDRHQWLDKTPLEDILTAIR